MLLQRKRGTITARNMEGRNFSFPTTFTGSESVLFEISEPQKYPELQLLTGEFNKWRFYHDFRTDLDSPIRQPQMGTLTPIMSNDGRDLIAAIATIKAIGNANRLERALQQAFPDHILRIAEDVEVNDEGEETPGSGELTLYLTVPGLYRELTAMEFSDGTLQFLCLMGALLTPRPAPFMVLNEPETSIHPDLYEPIADLIVDASKKSQILMTTHAKQLAGIIKEKCKDARVIELTKVNGATTVVGSGSNLGKCDEEFDE